MKRFIIFFVSIISPLCLIAQQTDRNSDYKSKIDSIFQYINLSSLETGILVDHGFNILDPSVYNGLENDTVYVDKGIMKALYAGLLDSKVNENCQLESNEIMLPKISEAKNISVLYLAYNNLSQSEFNRGALYLENEQLKIDYSKHPNIFEFNYCFAVALGNDEFTGKNVTLPIKIDNFVNNTLSKIAAIEIKADDGEYEKASIGTNWAHSFSTFGEHRLTFRIYFDDGYIMSCHTPITLNEPKQQSVVSTNVETFTKISADSEQAGGEIQVMYLNKEKTGGKFVRPLVIAGDLDLSQMLKGGDSPMSLAIINSSLGGKLSELAKLYDIIYLKYDNNTDDLLRNGRFFQKAITAINANRFAVADSTYVVGLGIGGVIARIGLNMMESDGESHGVCKFIAVDSPFRGVNIPVSLQYGIRQLAEVSNFTKKYGYGLESIKSISNLLDSKAMQQLLCYPIDCNFNKSDAIHKAFLNSKLVSQNPQKCVTVSMSNANTSVSNPLETLVNYTTKKTFKGQPYLGGKCKIEVTAKNLPKMGWETIYHGKYYFYRNIFGIHTAMYDSELERSNSTDMHSLDNESGVYIPPFNIEVTDKIQPFQTLCNFCLIPGFSSLDVDYESYKQADYDGKIALSQFTRCYLEPNASYESSATSMLENLYYELLPHIEGDTKDILNATELTLTNVPVVSVIKYDWSVKGNNFKVVSSSKNKATLAPINYSTLGNAVKDIVSVTPKELIPLGISGLSSLSVSTDVEAASVYIDGDNYISPNLSIYNISQLPKDVTSVNWTASSGMTLTPYEDLTVGAQLDKAVTENWIQASFTSNGINHDIRKELKVATIDSAKISIVKHWYDPNEQVAKYYIHVDVFPAKYADEMNYCWYNTVKISSSLFVSLSGEASIETDGDVGMCKFELTDSVTFKPGSGILKPITVASTPSIDELEETTIVPALMGKYDAIVSMPKIKTNQTASGSVVCIVSDQFKKAHKVSCEVEAHWSTAYCAAPNPANSILNIIRQTSFGNISAASVSDIAIAKLYNEQALVRSQVIDQDNVKIDVSDLPDGSYYLNILEDGNVVYKQTIIIKH